MFERASAKIWITRHAAISSFDPIAAAAQSLAECTIHEKLPTPKETHDLHGVIIVAPTPGAASVLQHNFQAVQSSTGNIGGKIPTLAIAADSQRSDVRSEPVCRTVLALDELMAFVQPQPTAPALNAA